MWVTVLLKGHSGVFCRMYYRVTVYASLINFYYFVKISNHIESMNNSLVSLFIEKTHFIEAPTDECKICFKI